MKLDIIFYRLEQVRQQLGFAAPLSSEQQAEVARRLSASAVSLFRTMSNADRQHALRVCRGLQAEGCTEEDMLAAALLHDVGKAQGRVPFWTRPVIVISKKLAPSLLARFTVYPKKDKGWQRMPHWQRSLSYAWYHAEVGAEMAAQVGLSERVVLYIRTHHQSDGPAALLHKVDEVS